jgi:broad specificity phosphatase PhoE
VYLRLGRSNESRHIPFVLFDRYPPRGLMTTFLLIRHGHCDPVGRSIAGRKPGVHLNARGRAEAEILGQRLSSVDITAIYSSPLERALETAAAVATLRNLPVETSPALTEIDFGEWTGRTLAELSRLAEWKAFNSFRSGTRIPGGESAFEVLGRALGEIDRLCKIHRGPHDIVALVSHGDVLRALVAHFLGMPTDLLQRIELSPASVTVLSVIPSGPQLLLLNSTDQWPTQLLASGQRS